MSDDNASIVGWAFGGIVLVTSIAAGSCWGCPQYGVYSQRLEGEAELAKANYSKQVAVQEANAKRDSATLLATCRIAHLAAPSENRHAHALLTLRCTY